ncbi:MAG: (d)CMP kinase [Thermodesulfobacteriota bacterium]
MTPSGTKTTRAVVVAVDGPGGVGKTTVSKLLAGRLGLGYVDTGAMYRAVALAAHRAGVDLESTEELSAFCSGAEVEYDAGAGSVRVNGEDYTGIIRTAEAGRLASIASSRAPVRRLLTGLQRELAREGSVVMEGRDIGTVVLPGADIKFFLDAPGGVRAGRRHGELSGEDLASVGRELAERDRRDSSRENSPLVMADDAIYVDTGNIDIEGVLAVLMDHMRRRGLIADG